MLLHLFHAYLFPLSKKTSSRFLFFIFCSAFPCIQFIANLFVRSYLSKWAEVTSVFSVMNSVTPACYFRSHRNLSVLPKYTTRWYRFQNRKNNLPLIPVFFWSSSTQWILSSTSITFFLAALICDSRTKPICDNKSIRPFLEIDVKGEERDHIKTLSIERDHIKLYHISRGREYSKKESNFEGSQMLGVQEERSHMSWRGEKTCSYLFGCLYALALIVCSLSSPNIPS